MQAGGAGTLTECWPWFGATWPSHQGPNSAHCTQHCGAAIARPRTNLCPATSSSSFCAAPRLAPAAGHSLRRLFFGHVCRAVWSACCTCGMHGQRPATSTSTARASASASAFHRGSTVPIHRPTEWCPTPTLPRMRRHRYVGGVPAQRRAAVPRARRPTPDARCPVPCALCLCPGAPMCLTPAAVLATPTAHMLAAQGLRR